MPNRYASLVGSNKIRDEYQKINIGFDRVQQEIDAEVAAREALDQRVDTIIQGGGPDKDAELVDIRTPDPSYTPGRAIAVAGDAVRDIQAQLSQLKENYNRNAFKVIDVSSFGAVGDGVTDDTSSIQNAIDAAGENGIVVFKQNAIHVISAELNIPYNITLVGNGATIVATHAGVALRAQGEFVTAKNPTADYLSGDVKISLDDVTGIEVGQIISIRSTELFNTSRSYFYKGGNCLVTRIEGNDVYLSMPFPFDMSASSLQYDSANNTGILFYNPTKVHIKDLTIVHSGTLPDGLVGILLAYAKNCIIENVLVDNFVTCIELTRCVNVDLSGIETGRAYYEGSSTSYGIANKSCTNVTVRNSNIASGIVGYATGGSETVFGVVCESSMFTSENRSYGFSMHDNAYSCSIRDCEITGMKLAGNCIVENSIIQVYVGSNNYYYLGVGERFQDCSYTFRNCTIQNGTFRLTGQSQLATLTRKYCGGINFEKCRGNVVLYLDLELTYGDEITGEINSIVIEETDEIQISVNDNIDRMILRNCRKSTDTGQLIRQISNKGRINLILLDNVGVPEDNRTIQITNFKNFVFNHCYVVPTNSAYKNMEFDSADGRIILNYSTLDTISIIITSALSELYVNQSTYSFASGSAAKVTTKKQAVYEDII